MTGLQLRCEPGRSVLNGCGMTVAPVEFTKQHHTGDWFIGLALQERNVAPVVFMVDHIVIPRAELSFKAISGYLVGAYCTESGLITSEETSLCSRYRCRRPRCLPGHRGISDALPRKSLSPIPTRKEARRRRRNSSRKRENRIALIARVRPLLRIRASRNSTSSQSGLLALSGPMSRERMRHC